VVDARNAETRLDEVVEMKLHGEACRVDNSGSAFLPNQRKKEEVAPKNEVRFQLPGVWVK
jgi:hypothetical protein